MADIVVTEFMDLDALAPLKRRFSVQVDTELWGKPDALAQALPAALGLIVRNRTQVNAAVLAMAPCLKVIGRLGVGLDNIDLNLCKVRNIVVCPAVGANAVSVAEYVIGSALMLARSTAYTMTADLIAGRWPREKASNGWELAGKRLGIIGYGNIGQTVAASARAIGMSVGAFDDFVPSTASAWKATERQPLEALLAASDVVSLHCPLTPETRNLLDARRLALMKKGSLLINAARGGVVHEPSLADALRSGQLGGAAMDVFDVEPIDPASGAVFAGVPNLILTPHVAGVTRESNDRISSITVENVRRVLEG